MAKKKKKNDSDGPPEIPRLAGNGRRRRERLLVVAAQPLLSKRVRARFPQASEALSEHHSNFRDQLGNDRTHVVTSFDGTIIAITTSDQVHAALAAAWRHLDARGGADARDTLWTAKMAASLGEVVDLSADDGMPLVPHGPAVDEIVRLLRDVAEDGELLITHDVQRGLQTDDERKFKAGQRTFAVRPQPLRRKTLVPDADEVRIGVIKAASEATDDVVIVYRPGLRSHLAAVEQGLRGFQDRFERMLTSVRGSLRDPTGSTGSDLNLAEQVEDFRSAVEGEQGPAVILGNAWKAARAELHDDAVLAASIDFVVDTAADLLDKLVRLEQVRAEGKNPSPAYSRLQSEIESLLPKLNAAPGKALAAAAKARARHEDRFDADF